MKIYHGSISIIRKPIYGYGSPYNDYGLGFYCTEEKELAKEWAVDYELDGYANCYELDLSNLLNGNTPEQVDELIKSIGIPLSLSSQDAVDKALAAYNALSDADKAKVNNYPLLSDYLAQLQKLKENAGNNVPKTGVE